MFHNFKSWHDPTLDTTENSVVTCKEEPLNAHGVIFSPKLLNRNNPNIIKEGELTTCNGAISGSTALT